MNGARDVEDDPVQGPVRETRCDVFHHDRVALRAGPTAPREIRRRRLAAVLLRDRLAVIENAASETERRGRNAAARAGSVRATVRRLTARSRGATGSVRAYRRRVAPATGHRVGRKDAHQSEEVSHGRELPAIAPATPATPESGRPFARRYSPSVFACGSLRVDAATPSPKSPLMTKFSARIFGNRWRSTSRGRVSGRSSFSFSTVRNESMNRKRPPSRPKRPGSRCRPCRPSGCRRAVRAA